MAATIHEYDNGLIDEHLVESPSKRRRILLPKRAVPSTTDTVLSVPCPHYISQATQTSLQEQVCGDNEDEDIPLSASSKRAGQTVAPFLARHIPDQYAHMGVPDQLGNSRPKDPNSKYCYRHDPVLKCQRLANEPEILQHDLEDLSQRDQQAINHVWSVYSAAPPKQRNLILRGILSQCCSPQLTYLNTTVPTLIRVDFLDNLPAELSYKILCFLDTTSLCKAAQVSRKWRNLADDDVVWHRMCEQHIDRKCTKCGWGLPLLERKQLRAFKRQIQLRASGRGPNDWPLTTKPNPEVAPGALYVDASQDDNLRAAANCQSAALPDPSMENLGASLLDSKNSPLPVSSNDESYLEPKFESESKTRPWKDVYRDRFLVGTNWKYGRCNVRIFRGHSNGVMALQFDSKILITGSYDSTLKVWDLELGEEIRTLRGHTSGIRCLQFDDSKLISGSIDRTVKIWNWRTGECISTYTGHTGSIIGLHFDSAILATGSVDTNVKIWNFEDKSSFLLRGHTDWVNAVRVDSASRTVFSASDDCTTKLWDLDSKTCIKTFRGHVGQVQQIVLLPTEFEIDLEDTAADDNDGNSSTASAGTGSVQCTDRPVAEPYGPGFTTCDRPLPPRFFLTGSLDNTMKLWDSHHNKCLRTYFGHIEGIWALAADTLRIVSGGEDRMTKVWDLRSGRCERTFTGHSGPVTCAGLSDSRMCTGGEDCDVRMYSF